MMAADAFLGCRLGDKRTQGKERQHSTNHCLLLLWSNFRPNIITPTGHSTFFSCMNLLVLVFPHVMCAYIIKVRSGMVVILHLRLSITRWYTLDLHTDFMASAKKSRCAPIKNTCCVWAGGTNANYPDFCENHQFHVIYCITLMCVLYFEDFQTHDSH